MKHVTPSGAGALPVARFIVCGRSLGFRQIVRDEFVTPAESVMSVMTDLIVLQGGGQALIPGGQQTFPRVAPRLNIHASLNQPDKY